MITRRPHSNPTTPTIRAAHQNQTPSWQPVFKRKKTPELVGRVQVQIEVQAILTTELEVAGPSMAQTKEATPATRDSCHQGQINPRDRAVYLANCWARARVTSSNPTLSNKAMANLKVTVGIPNRATLSKGTEVATDPDLGMAADTGNSSRQEDQEAWAVLGLVLLVLVVG